MTSQPGTPARAVSPAGNATVGLVSMPWMAPAMPSIQLATLEAALRASDIRSDVYEFYVDYAAEIGLNNYRMLSRLLGFNAEWIFARHYFGPEQGDWLDGFLPHRPGIGLSDRRLEEDVLAAFAPVTENFLDRVAGAIDWSHYRVLGFSLCLTQVAASFALARRIKLRHPDVTIVFGGAECAGPMGPAMLRICPYVDIVVQVEGEPVLPELVRRLETGKPIDDLAGIAFRQHDGSVGSNPGPMLYTNRADRPTLDYAPYFARLRACGLADRLEPWLPFESSRGCWYGEKQQCTFCGLHEIMESRSWSADIVLAEMEELHDKHQIGRFFAVDLILPRDYLTTLLPEIERRGHDWSIFYEVKANLRRHQVEQLAAAGVTWVQPGIESLDDEILRLMNKGVKALQNIQLLKWCREYGIRVGWNMITGLPGETDDAYERMLRFLGRLRHLAPPSGLGRFQLHRFSPYFDRPEHYGLRRTGAHPLYRYVFPVAQDDLDDLVYLHDYELDTTTASDEQLDLVRQAVTSWWRDFTKGARLSFTRQPGGSGRIHDGRDPARQARIHELSPEEADLYAYLDTARSRQGIREWAGERAPRMERVLERWEQEEVTLELAGRVLALALGTGGGTGRLGQQFPSPVPYLDPPVTQLDRDDTKGD